MCVTLGGASAALGQGGASLSTQSDSVILEGVVLEGDSAVEAATVILHRVRPDGSGAGPVSGEVASTTVGPAGEFEFLLPSIPGGDFEGDVYFASVEYDGVLYFGRGITSAEQLDSLYVVQVFQAEEVPAEGVALTLSVRNLFIEFGGEEWFATDLFVIDNPGTRTLVARENGIVWSYPLPRGAVDPVLGDSDMPPDAVVFENGRVRVNAPLPPGGRLLIVRYRLEELGAAIPAPGRTEVFELMIREPAPPLRVEGLEAMDVVALEGGSTYRRYGAAELEDVTLALVETRDLGPPPLEWLGVLASVLLAMGGFLAYARPRRRGYAGQPPGVGREALILEVARIDDALDGPIGDAPGARSDDAPAEQGESNARSELLERRAAFLSLLRDSG